ncbi:CC0125/CC1285 family lipoprotein [Erythrobacter ani]|uniref:DUF4136 domain-containing protein n=1 Tax=Erythrobacter ani TaxID=2827235 RepID=A0ABS6SLU4_9SPHN|nr:hypothetical protein [Erythrobacter ani]MBV7265477.1 hypothetical protein [Erythrobacter ani]
MPSIKRRIAATTASAIILATTGCAMSSTPYQPLSAGSRVSGGYADLRIDETHYRVSFAGNRLTSRERVESYLLFRAAELTLLKGYDYFIIQDREVEHQIERQIRRDPIYDPWYSPYHTHWRPYWRYYRTGRGWYHWYPYFGDPFWADRYSVRMIERFEANADIVMGKGERPNGNLRSFDALEVRDRLSPQIEYPND